MMQVLKNSLESLVIQMFPDGRLDTKNAALYLGLKEKTLAMMRSFFLQVLSDLFYFFGDRF